MRPPWANEEGPFFLKKKNLSGYIAAQFEYAQWQRVFSMHFPIQVGRQVGVGVRVPESNT